MLFTKRHADLVADDNSGTTVKNSKEGIKILRMLTPDWKQETDHNNVHKDALFLAQIERIRTELAVIDKYMESCNELPVRDLDILKTPIDRLYQYLVHEKDWRNITPYLNLMTDFSSHGSRTHPELTPATKGAPRRSPVQQDRKPFDPTS